MKLTFKKAKKMHDEDIMGAMNVLWDELCHRSLQNHWLPKEASRRIAEANLKMLEGMVNRIEVIENGWRELVRTDCKPTFSLQDDGKTLKILLEK